MRPRFVLLCAVALGLAGLGQMEGKGKAKSKGRDKSPPVVAVPEPPALVQSLIYLGGVLGAGWLVRRKTKAIHER